MRKPRPSHMDLEAATAFNNYCNLCGGWEGARKEGLLLPSSCCCSPPSSPDCPAASRGGGGGPTPSSTSSSSSSCSSQPTWSSTKSSGEGRTRGPAGGKHKGNHTFSQKPLVMTTFCSNYYPAVLRRIRVELIEASESTALSRIQSPDRAAALLHGRPMTEEQLQRQQQQLSSKEEPLSDKDGRGPSNKPPVVVIGIPSTLRRGPSSSSNSNSSSSNSSSDGGEADPSRYLFRTLDRLFALAEEGNEIRWRK